VILSSYFTCGILYSIYTFQKIFNNKEQFLIMFEEEFGNTDNLNPFLATMFLTSTVAWPIMILNEINNRQDLQ
jgi:hypothetical protein